MTILSCSRTTPVPFLPIPRLHPGPVFGPRRGAACASTCLPPPRVELAVGVHERAHLEHAIDDHLRERTTFGTLDEATHQNYQRLLARHVYPTLGPKPVGSVHRDDLVRLFQRLLTGIDDGRKRGKATCRNHLSEPLGPDPSDLRVVDHGAPDGHLDEPCASLGQVAP